MSFRKKMHIRIALLLAAAGLALGLLLSQYVMVDFRVYPRAAQTLDLTGREVTVSHYEKLRRKLPGCDIIWQVPLSGGSRDSRSRTITISSLSREDVAAVAFFPDLQTIDARSCRDYEWLLELVKAYPELRIDYSVPLGADRFSPNDRQIEVRNVPQEDFSRLACLPRLEEVICAGGADAPALMRYCHDAGIDFSIRAGDRVLEEFTRNAAVTGVTEEQLPLLELLPELKILWLKDPQAAPESLVRLREAMPGTQIHWELELGGIRLSSNQRELDISQGEVYFPEIREKIAYFPDAETLFLGLRDDIDNQVAAAFREELREKVKLVWVVRLGKKLTARTDDKSFMPVREHVYYFNDKEAYNLRYCEEMECIDIGHMSIHDIAFVKYMPNLTYLILAHTQLNYIEPISTCKKLKFLELDWSPVRDLSPLVGCTGLEDLNLGMTYASFAPIRQMTWLKNLWVIDCNDGVGWQMRQALPNTHVQSSGSATVASGWRRLPNYYAMRDALGMYYMHWD